jgi:hypothetical protein
MLFLGVLLSICHQSYVAAKTVADLSLAPKKSVNVAFLGNSMIYFNDFPRYAQHCPTCLIVKLGPFVHPTDKFLKGLLTIHFVLSTRHCRYMEEIMGDGLELHQNSCLHGGASIQSLFTNGNGMNPMFATDKAIIGEYKDWPIYDFGTCTPAQLVMGYDADLHDPSYSIFTEDNSTTLRNPCRDDKNYLDWSIHHFPHHSPDWDFIFMNDNTRNPARVSSRAQALDTLEHMYLPWFLETGAKPVFLWTQAYEIVSTSARNMTGIDDVANFTSLTGAGLRSYVDMLSEYLPPSQKPLIAPVGLGFLTVREENIELWKRLFHSDFVHASPLGTFLQGCIVHYTLTGKMPSKDIVFRKDMSTLWWRARVMQHPWEPPNPFPTEEEAEYLYDVAERVSKFGHLPATYIHYTNGEAAADI